MVGKLTITKDLYFLGKITEETSKCFYGLNLLNNSNYTEIDKDNVNVVDQNSPIIKFFLCDELNLVLLCELLLPDWKSKYAYLNTTERTFKRKLAKKLAQQEKQ